VSPPEPFASLRWPTPITALDAKRELATTTAGLVRAALAGFGARPTRIGLGSGSTSFLTLLALVDVAVEHKSEVAVVATSYEMEWYAAAAGFPVVPLDDTGVAVAFDGADQADPSGALVKGRGGAMGRERAVLRAAERELIMIDPSKQVDELGGCPLPLELRPSGIFATVDAVEAAASAAVVLRSGSGKDGPVITESGGILADLMVPAGTAVSAALDARIRAVAGVRDTGYFAPSPKRALVTG